MTTTWPLAVNLYPFPCTRFTWLDRNLLLFFRESEIGANGPCPFDNCLSSFKRHVCLQVEVSVPLFVMSAKAPAINGPLVLGWVDLLYGDITEEVTACTRRPSYHDVLLRSRRSAVGYSSKTSARVWRVLFFRPRQQHLLALIHRLFNKHTFWPTFDVSIVCGSTRASFKYSSSSRAFAGTTLGLLG